jgi:hypothetical protein
MQTMQQDFLKPKARRLLAQRSAEVTTWTYLRQNLARHLTMTAIFGALTAGAWAAGVTEAALVIGTLWAARLMRDIQWYARLAGEWPSTREFIDWERVETIANS